MIRAAAFNGGIRKFKLPSTGLTLGGVMTFDAHTPRWKVIKDIATAKGFEVFFDGSGYLVMREFRDPATSPLAFTFETGEMGNLASYTKSSSQSSMCNVVHIVSESGDGLPIVGIAENHEP